jgi:replicative DNA helicase
MNNINNERIILDCAMMSPTLLPYILDTVKDIDFYYENHRILFNAIKELYEKKLPVSIASIYKHLADKKLQCDIKDILRSWTGGDVKPFIESLLDDSNRRQIKDLLARQNELIVDRGYTIDQITNEVDTKLREITACQISPITMLSDMKTGDINDLGSDKKVKKTGYAELDRNLWGISGGELIILAAQTSHGKTSIAGNMATFIANKYEDYVLWFSLEMPKQQMRRRFVAQYAEVDNLKIKMRRLDQSEQEKVKTAMEKVDELNIALVDNKFERDEIISIARKFSHRRKIDLIVVDYLQQISNFINGASLAQIIGNTVISLKKIAVELEVPIICLSQFNRKFEGDREPMLSDLKESSTIEQAADMVWFLHKYSDKQKNDLGSDYTSSIDNLYKFIVAKNRDGKANFSVDMQFTPEYTRFQEV